MSEPVKRPAIDPKEVQPRIGASYPKPFDADCATREKCALGDALGLSAIGVNLTTLPPGAWSAQRHWHSAVDEFVYVLDGELTLVTDAGEQILGPGMAAGFPAGQPDGHHLVNRSDRPATYLEIGDRQPNDTAQYPDVDLYVEVTPEGYAFSNKKGEPY